MDLTPIYRIEKFLDAIVNGTTPPEPIHRVEFFLAKIAGADVETPEPIYRIEKYLAKILGEAVEIPEPVFRNEFWLAKKCGMDVDTPEPLYRMEFWLDEWVGGTPSQTLTVTGVSPLSLVNAIAHLLVSLTQEGKTSQASNPSPSEPKDNVCNNGALKLGAVGKNLFSTTIEQGSIASATGEETASTARCRSGYIPVKPNTTYTVSAVIDGYTSGSSRGIYVYEYTADSYYTNSWQAPSGVTFTTHEDTLTVRFVFGKSQTGTTTPSDISNVQLELGSSATSYEPYRAGLVVDGTAEVLTIGGKNKIDLKKSEAVISGWNVTFPFTIKPGTYIVSCQRQFGGTTNKGASVSLRDANDTNLLTFTGYQFGNSEFVGPARLVTEEIAAATVAITFGCTEGIDSTEVDSIINAGIQLELGSTATDYEPFTSQTASVQNLFAVGNYADTQDIVSGTVTRQIGIKVFDGTEDGWGDSGNNVFSTGRNMIPDRLASKVRILCTHFRYSESASSAIQNGYFGAANSTANIYFRNDSSANLEEWKAWLAAQYAAGTPVIVVYPLAEATTEHVTGQNLSTVSGTNVLTVTAEVSDIPLTVQYKGTA